MSNDDWEHDDEDWTDDIDVDDQGSDEDDETTSCPECGAEMYGGTDKCPACGYWLSAADRRAAGTDNSQPRYVRAVAVAVLVVVLIALLVAGIGLF